LLEVNTSQKDKDFIIAERKMEEYAGEAKDVEAEYYSTCSIKDMKLR
jgi:hypothetical protein